MTDRDKFYVATVAALVLGFLLIITVAFPTTPAPHDDTDPPQGYSKLDIYQDSKTGCQYLGLAQGGLTPRIDRNGKPVCLPENADM